MCHGYRVRSWTSERATKKKTEDTRVDARVTATAASDEKPEPVRQAEAEKEELVPAE